MDHDLLHDREIAAINDLLDENRKALTELLDREAETGEIDGQMLNYLNQQWFEIGCELHALTGIDPAPYTFRK